MDELDYKIYKYEQAMEPNTSSQVYLARCLASGALKVGVTKNPTKRLRGLRQAYDTPVEYMILFPPDHCAGKLEAAIHRTLRSLGYSYEGEWYPNLSHKEALDIIQEVIKQHLKGAA